ncbi:MAG TPA: glycosyltransferase, partial [Solirubrobacteraceae bacterium]|nr:glycosyltransferase [Solirubrobacteraceae bacterium]
MKVSQILCAGGPVDAVTNQALAWRRRFQAWGWEGEEYVANVAPGVTPRILRPLRDYQPAGEPVVLHYSGHASGLEDAVNGRTLLVSHNVTPARFFWAYQPVDAARSTLARDQLAQLGRRAGALAGVSEYNAHELSALSGRDAGVIPVLFEDSALPAAGPEPAPGAPTVLFVGRLAPHKRQDLVIEAFAGFRRRQPDARLVLVGTSLNQEFEAELRRLADRLAPGAVGFHTGGISGEQLTAYYGRAHAFLCLSEHEGFCIPLLEAFHFGVPVIARDV